MRSTRLLALLLAVTLPLAACSDDPVSPPALATVETTLFGPSLGIDLNAAGWTKTATGLHYRTLTAAAPTAPVVANGQRVTVRYTGWLSGGAQFESSTYTFVLGSGAVIPGWDQGIVGMRVGEKRRLLIPPALAYGPNDYFTIPGNSVLVFDVEVTGAT